MRVALYARYSSDKQNECSAEDQLSALRRHAEARGWTVAAALQDAGISGATIGARAGLQALLALAKGRAVDLVLAEDLDRLSRDQEGLAHIHKALRHAGVELETLGQGRVAGMTGVMQIGMAATMGQLYLEQLAHKTRRGLEARVRAGFSGGGRCYGYTLGKDKGVLEIEPQEAEVIRGIFEGYGSGRSPRQIAAMLNSRGVPGPRGGEWTGAAINGDCRAGDGLLHQELYVGVRVFNRRTFRKDPETGRRSGVLNAPDSWIREPVPHLRIIDDALWRQVQTRKADLPAQTRKIGRPAKRLLSGLLRCGVCGGGMTIGGQPRRYRCSTRVERGSCTNTVTALATDAEARVLAGLQERLLAPNAATAAVRAYAAEMASVSAAASRDRSEIERDLCELQRRIDRAADSYERGVFELDELERRVGPLKTRRADLRARLADADLPAVVQLHPRAAAQYRELISQLGELTPEDEPEELNEALRGLIEEVGLVPTSGRGAYKLVVTGKLKALLADQEGITEKENTGCGDRI